MTNPTVRDDDPMPDLPCCPVEDGRRLWVAKANAAWDTERQAWRIPAVTWELTPEWWDASPDEERRHAMPHIHYTSIRFCPFCGRELEKGDQ